MSKCFIAFEKMLKERNYWVYIMANTGGRAATLYIGVTNDLERRVFQHQNPDLQREPQSFTVRYRVTRLVYAEEFHDIRDAIAWEKRIKGWRRERKLELIESRNPDWRDLSAGWETPTAG